MVAFLLLVLSIALSSADRYVDSSCERLKCSRAEMKAINQAKMLGLGEHSCMSTYIKLNPDGTQNLASSVSYPSTVTSYYDSGTGALHSDYSDVLGSVVSIDEYCDGKGHVCIEVVNATSSGYYTESIDQNKNGMGSVWRAIGYYTPNAKKSVKGLQWFVPTKFGDLLSLTFLDDNDKMDYIMLQTCTLQ